MESTELYLLAEIENILGKSHKKSKSNYAFHCPFCNHPKPKLEVNVKTDDRGNNPFNCWVCGTRGRKLKSLLQLLRTPKDVALGVLKYVRKGESYEETNTELVQLPKENRPLLTASLESILAAKARHYLNKRGITDLDIRKYNIGYAVEGVYADRIIIPSYNEFGQLNYFVTRTLVEAFQKYKMPEAGASDIVFFESNINWNLPITLCEGVFDAIAIKRNAVPLLGKFMQPALKKKLLQSSVQDIYIALDPDAKKEAYKLSEELTRMGKTVQMIDIQEGDPSSIGFKNFRLKYRESKTVDTKTLLEYKLSTI